MDGKLRQVIEAFYFSHQTYTRKVFVVLDKQATRTHQKLGMPSTLQGRKVLRCSICQHTRQPLDMPFLKPLSIYVNQASDKRIRSNSQRSVTQFTISEVLCEAYGKLTTFGKAIDVFAKTVTWPVDRGVLQDYDFVPDLRQPWT
jgi:hypothetical protein